jgi:apolipoprotein N-acyltransferase
MVFLIFVSSLLLYLSFPNGFSHLGISFLAWFFAIPLFFAFDKCSVVKRLMLGLAWGLIFYSFLVSWIIPYSFIGYILFVAILCVQPVIFALFYKREDKGSLLNIFYIPAVWVSSECIRNLILGTFYWDIGHSQSFNNYIIQISNLIGSSGVSFVLIFVNYCVYKFIIQKEQRKSVSFVALVLILLVFLYGHVSVLPQTKNVLDVLKVCTIQPNIASIDKVDPDKIHGFVKENILLSKECADKHTPDLIVWPETAAPLDVLRISSVKNKLSGLAVRTRSYLLIGASLFRDGKDHNSAILIDPLGEVVDIYNKQQLIPFSEYVPAGWFWKFIRMISQKESYNFKPGAKPGILFLNKKNPDDNSLAVKFGIAICSEETSGFLFRSYGMEEASFVVSMLNDGWFDEERALIMHTQSAVMHAVENRMPIVRAANTGWSVYIDGYGRISNIKNRKTNERATFFHVVKRDKGKTFYNKIGHIFPCLCVCFVIIICLVVILKRMFFEKGQ